MCSTLHCRPKVESNNGKHKEEPISVHYFDLDHKVSK